MKLEKYSKSLLRITMSFIFLYFGYQQLASPENWIGFVPSIIITNAMSAQSLVITNAFLELGLGSLLLIGLYTRPVSLILSLHLFLIAFSIGLNPLGARDFGLAIATLVIFLNGSDHLCIDNKIGIKR
jgi:uncharacterized membrane protein YphA (DoxX/SURF4 family)